MRAIVLSGQYKRDLKLARRRGLPEDELNDVILSLALDKVLPADKHDHAFAGKLAGLRECHIRPDWLLVYGKEDNEEIHILNLYRTGTHADLFRK